MLPKTYNPDDSIGVRKDVLVDARMELADAEHKLREMHVALDVIADDRDGIWSEDEYGTLRRLQSEVSTLINSVQDDLDDVNQELERIADDERA